MSNSFVPELSVIKIAPKIWHLSNVLPPIQQQRLFGPDTISVGNYVLSQEQLARFSQLTGNDLTSNTLHSPGNLLSLINNIKLINARNPEYKAVVSTTLPDIWTVNSRVNFQTLKTLFLSTEKERPLSQKQLPGINNSDSTSMTCILTGPRSYQYTFLTEQQRFDPSTAFETVAQTAKNVLKSGGPIDLMGDLRQYGKVFHRSSRSQPPAALRPGKPSKRGRFSQLG
jgi:hypothetical protein